VTPVLRGDWIRERRKARGFARLEDLAVAADITRQQLHRLLNGECLPNATTAHNLAAALRCSVDDLYEAAA
jgi:transcriptional regulator with XRE-family HTH domain